MNQRLPDEFVLDIDMDFFAPQMDYLSKDLKIKKIKDCVARAQFITIATSPYFMEQQEAVKLIREILSSEGKGGLV